MRVWSMGYSSKDGWKLHVIEAAAWRVALEEYGVPALNFMTGHLFCCRIPESAFKIPLRRSRGPYDDHLVSLGSKMFDLGQWINTLGTFGHASKEVWVPIDCDLASRINPEFVAEYQAVMNDDGDQTDA